MRMIRTPSAWVPMVLSLAALALIVGFVARFGVVHAEDEGTAARVFQLLMVGIGLGITYFAIRWVPVAPKPASAIVAVQVLLAAVPVVTIILLGM
jgi:hypothetical protein